MSARIIVIVLLLANVISAIGVVHARYRHRQLFFQLTRLEQARDALNIEFSRLQLEQATWAESHRIDTIARERLGMRPPEPADTAVLRP